MEQLLWAATNYFFLKTGALLYLVAAIIFFYKYNQLKRISMSYRCGKCGVKFNSQVQAKCGRCTEKPLPLPTPYSQAYAHPTFRIKVEQESSASLTPNLKE